MTKILLLLFAGVIPVFTQYIHDLRQQQLPANADYADFGEYNNNDGQQQQGTDFGIPQPSFYASYSGKSENDNRQSDGISSVISGSYGGLTPPPPTTADQVNNVHNFYPSERRVIVPSSLRELEESYIRSLSTGTTGSAKHSYLGPFGESRNSQAHQQQQQQQRGQQNGVENFSAFLMNKRHYNKNDHLRASQRHQRVISDNPNQNAPITYGFPLLNQHNQQVSATNAIDAHYGRKTNGKHFDYSQKNNVPNFPDLSDRPPIPEEPEIPSSEEDEVEQATRRPPARFALPTPPNFQRFNKVSPSPLASPPSIFDPSFPDPVLQRGFIPSFGPPTKEPIYSNKPSKSSFLEQELHHNHLASQVEVSTTSPVPVLRPTFSTEKDTNDILPDEASSDATNPDDKPQEGTIYKHISVHVPAEDLDEEISAPQVVKVAKKPEKHIKVIFIKPPDSPTHKTEVEVPAGPQQKTLVYVLSESGGTRTPIKLITPAPLKPAPPQVFFLRYTEPSTGASQPTPSSAGEGGSKSKRPSTTPPIKQLASPLDPDADFLRSAPPPVLPTFPSRFTNSANTALSHQLALQSALASPSLFTNANYKNDINDPTNSKYQGVGTSNNKQPNSLFNDNYFNSNHLAALKYTNSFPTSSVQPPANTNPYSQSYYSSLHHLYPPPTIASTSNQNLLSLYFNPDNNYQQQSQQETYPQNYRSGHSKTRTTEQPSPSSIQGLYTVAPNVENLPGINFNYLVQNPDGKNPPRSPRNFVMMNYAPTYMPSASGSEDAPVFTSPADIIKSLLGDSYMYYNNIGNNSLLPPLINHRIQQPESETTTSTTTTTTSTTTTTPAPPQVKSVPQSQAQHHTIPLIASWGIDVENLTRSIPDYYTNSQPIALLVGNGADANANFHLQNAKPVYPHLRPLFPYFPGTTTTTPKPQPRMSSASLNPTSPPTTPKPHVPLPIVIYEGSDDIKNSSNSHQTTGDSVSSHFNNLFDIIQHHAHHTSPRFKETHIRDTINQTNNNTSEPEQSTEYSQSDSSSGSEESGEGGDNGSSSAQQISGEVNSGEEIVPIYYEPTRVNLGSDGGYSSSIKYINNNSKNRHSSSNPETSSSKRRSSKKGRKRVNPAHVKPGRRLRKVRKPNKSRKNKRSEGNSDYVTQTQNS